MTFETEAKRQYIQTRNSNLKHSSTWICVVIWQLVCIKFKKGVASLREYKSIPLPFAKTSKLTTYDKINKSSSFSSVNLCMLHRFQFQSQRVIMVWFLLRTFFWIFDKHNLTLPGVFEKCFLSFYTNLR